MRPTFGLAASTIAALAAAPAAQAALGGADLPGSYDHSTEAIHLTAGSAPIAPHFGAIYSSTQPLVDYWNGSERAALALKERFYGKRYWPMPQSAGAADLTASVAESGADAMGFAGDSDGDDVDANEADFSAFITSDCGMPSYAPARDQGLLLWQDCDAGSWHLRVSGGGSQSTVRFQGKLTSGIAFAGTSGVSLETSDLFDAATDTTVIDFDLRVVGAGEDGIDFSLVEGANACLELELASGSILVGSERAILAPPFDLESRSYCTAADMALPPVAINVAGDDAAEGESEVTFLVTLAEATPRTVTVDFATADGSAVAGADYQTTQGTLSFEPGETAKSISVPLLDDERYEDRETFTLALSNPEGGELAAASAIASIEDDDTNPCGAPSYAAGSESSVLLWRDCAGGSWHLRATAGGSASTVRFVGSLAADQPLSSVTPYSVESSDVVDATTDTSVISYDLRMIGAGEDGFDFELAASSSACIDISSPTGTQVLVGGARTPLSTPVELDTFGSCTMPTSGAGTGDGGSTPPQEPAPPAISTYPFLDDATYGIPGFPGTGMIDLEEFAFPRIMLAETKSLRSAVEAFSKYRVISSQGLAMRRVAKIQSAFPEVKYFRHFPPIDYQGYTRPYGELGKGLPFEQTTNATGAGGDGTGIYAGHWLYNAGTRLSSAAGTSDLTLSVEDASKVAVGKYVVIYDAPFGSFKNAEHAKVVARNLNATPNTLTLEARGYKSSPRRHSAGAVVAQHAEGQCGDSRCWAYNQSTECPKDAAGKMISQHMADWLVRYYKADEYGVDQNVRVDGIMFDVDYQFIWHSNVDANNDGIADMGIGPDGRNWWGDGLRGFYSMVRQRFPNLLVVAGSRNSRTDVAVSGYQAEGAFVDGGFYDPNPSYRKINEEFGKYSFWANHSEYGPAGSHVLMKTPTASYPDTYAVTSGNRALRFALGLTLLENGYFSVENSSTEPDKWFDEFAVNVNPGSPEYGRAVGSDETNQSAIRANLGWLGYPQGPRRRLYDHDAFDPARSLIQGGDFEGGMTGWSGNNLNIGVTSSAGPDGERALWASTMSTYSPGLLGARLSAPAIEVVYGRDYTLSFAAKASSYREIKVQVGNYGQRFPVGPAWRRYVMSFKANQSGTFEPRFGLGREDTQFWLDGVYLHAGNANVLRRDFDNGVVVVNATEEAVQIDLGESLQRIAGTQDAVNDGSTVQVVQIPAHDAAILVRPDPGE